MQLKTLALAIFVAAPLMMSSTLAAAPSVSVSMDAATYSVVAAAGIPTPVATAVVIDAEGAPAAGAAVRFVFIRNVPLLGNVASETVDSIADANGVASAAAPTASGLPGDYRVIVSSLGAGASTSYSVGA